MFVLLLIAQLQVPDAACFTKYSKNADTLSKIYLPSTTLTAKQKAARARLDSLLHQKCVMDSVPPAPPVNQKPIASFTVAWAGEVATFTSTSTDDKGIANCTWRAVGRSEKTGCVATRDWVGTSWTEWLIVTDAEGLRDSTSRQLIMPPIPPTGPSVAELPRVYLNFFYPTPVRTIQVAAGTNLQAALNAAVNGDELVLSCSGSWTGNFMLPAKAAGGWVTIRSACLNQIPAQGTRIQPLLHANLMPKILTNNSQPALATVGASCGWWIAGVEVAVSASYTTQNYGIMTLGGNQSSVSAGACDIVLDRVYVHGQTTTQTSRCLALNSARTQITDSHISDCHGTDFDAQAIGGWNGAGPFKIVNNYLEGSHENVIFGGADPATFGLVPADIEIRRNHINTPIAWRGVWPKKNLIELKNATRVLMDGNVISGSWAHAQTGWAIVLMSTNQSSASNGNYGAGCTWCIASDITIRRNLIKNAGSGIGIYSGYQVDSMTTRRVTIAENVIDSIAVGVYGQPLGSGASDRRGFQMLAKTKAITFERNVLTGNLSAALISEGGAPCVFKDNVWNAGSYGVFAGGIGSGTTALNFGCGTGYIWSGMSLVGSSGGNPYPPGTTWLTSESQSLLAAQIRTTVQQATLGVVIP